MDVIISKFMRRTKIHPQTILALSEEFVKSRQVLGDTADRGRPREYDDSLILAIASVQNLYGFSYREALEFGNLFFEGIPSLSDFHYRISVLEDGFTEGFLVFLAEKLIKAGLKPDAYLIDGTGWSYHDLYPQELLRGAQVRKIKSHVRTIALVGVVGKKRFVLDAIPGKAYASEVKLGTKLIKQITFSRGSPFCADKAYDSINFLKTIIGKGCLPVVKIKGDESRHMNINHPLRIESCLNSSNPELYNKRSLVEGLFGNTKEKTGSNVRVFRTDIAQRFALIRLALFNISMLVDLETGKVWIFRTVSAFLTKTPVPRLVFFKSRPDSL
jgi:hypothetical protein